MCLILLSVAILLFYFLFFFLFFWFLFYFLFFFLFFWFLFYFLFFFLFFWFLFYFLFFFLFFWFLFFFLFFWFLFFFLFFWFLFYFLFFLIFRNYNVIIIIFCQLDSYLSRWMPDATFPNQVANVFLYLHFFRFHMPRGKFSYHVYRTFGSLVVWRQQYFSKINCVNSFQYFL